ncbi:hypothetical protein MTR67_011932 [Solanum verrucosum]|uniref:Gag-pol polyprotein n=1 Tax=Solanum verrucosum TaxID=315347 RepID=A0AAF0TFJ4_SOLVR|nr:hypothetical protein MTR67_011932 [Solanum verrucosum]
MKDFPMFAAKGRGGKQATTSGAGSNAPKQNPFYALKTRGEQEGSSDVFTGMLKVFQLDFYALLDPGATLSFGTPHVPIRVTLVDLVKLDKLDFDVILDFLCHIVSNKGIVVDPKKKDAVRSWPRPLTPSDIRSFLGLPGYYRMFVVGFSSIASPLTALTQMKAKFIWS